jgi:hypothetical protein
MEKDREMGDIVPFKREKSNSPMAPTTNGRK